MALSTCKKRISCRSLRRHQTNLSSSLSFWDDDCTQPAATEYPENNVVQPGPPGVASMQWVQITCTSALCTTSKLAANSSRAGRDNQLTAILQTRHFSLAPMPTAINPVLFALGSVRHTRLAYGHSGSASLLQERLVLGRVVQAHGLLLRLLLLLRTHSTLSFRRSIRRIIRTMMMRMTTKH